MIKPTVGRIVWFTPFQGDVDHFRHDTEQPFSATVTYVWSDRMVSLDVISHTGLHFPQTSVTLLQDDDVPPAHGGYAAWMPYQNGQAKKHGVKTTREARELATRLLSPEGRPLGSWLHDVEQIARYIETGEKAAA